MTYSDQAASGWMIKDKKIKHSDEVDRRKQIFTGIAICAGHGSGAVLHVQLLPLTRGPHGAWAHTSAAITARAVRH